MSFPFVLCSDLQFFHVLPNWKITKKGYHVFNRRNDHVCSPLEGKKKIKSGCFSLYLIFYFSSSLRSLSFFVFGKHGLRDILMERNTE